MGDGEDGFEAIYIGEWTSGCYIDVDWLNTMELLEGYFRGCFEFFNSCSGRDES